MQFSRLHHTNNKELLHIQAFYKKLRQKNRSQINDEYFCLYVEGKIAAMAKTQVLSESIGILLRNVIVSPQYRHKGLAKNLIKNIVHTSDKNTVYCFAYQHLEGLYRQCGFQPYAAETAHDLLQRKYARYQKSAGDNEDKKVRLMAISRK